MSQKGRNPDVSIRSWRRRRGYLWGYVTRRRYYAAILLALMAATVVLIWNARDVPQYAENLSLNLSGEIIGTVIIFFLIAPFLARLELRRESVRDRFDHQAFVRQVSDSKHRVRIMELWMDLLQGSLERPFLIALRTALDQDVNVRLLLLDPDARAAEQRADDLLRETDVVRNIMYNLRTLNSFRKTLGSRALANLEVRIYSALPPVQLYRVDDYMTVSFYPVKITSWNSTQYQTSPNTHFGTFVNDKFDELWQAESTRTLDQFRYIDIEIESVQKARRVRFVRRNGTIYASGRVVVADLLADAKLGGGAHRTAQVIIENARGDREVQGPYTMRPLVDEESEERVSAADQFKLKYGEVQHDVILKLSPSSTDHAGSDPTPVTEDRQAVEPA